MNSFRSALGRGRFLISAGFSLCLVLGTLFYVAHTKEIAQPHFSRVTEVATSTASGAEKPKWQQYLLSQASSPPRASDDVILSGASDALTERVSQLYTVMQKGGLYTPENLSQVGATVADTMKLEPTFDRITRAELTIDPDSSYDRMLTYRADMRVALEPLLTNKEPEFEVFARYLETKNEIYLEQLATTAANYTRAARQARAVPVPVDAAEAHVRTINSLSLFATTLTHMSKHGADPVASLMLLRAYNDAEQEVFSAFNELALYYRNKKHV
ncbi:hypothetical protein EBR66_01895 [bacterium]|nr:hypothetical protein [bacterium]